jgi:hypothetical protein
MICRYLDFARYDVCEIDADVCEIDADVCEIDIAALEIDADVCEIDFIVLCSNYLHIMPI